MMKRQVFMDVELELYAVQNQEGKWFRSKGYGGIGESWVEEFRNARFYGNIGPAKAVRTWFVKHYPQYGSPKVVRLRVTNIESE